MKSTNFMFICMLLVMAALVCVPVSAHVYVPDYTSKYVNPSDSVIPAGTGTVYVNTRSVNNLFDGSIIIYRVNPTYPYTNEHTIDAATAKKLIVNPNDNETMSFSIDGHQDYSLAAGQFVVELSNGDRGTPEYAYVNVVPGNTYHITFLGHASSIVGISSVTKSVNIIHAYYGAFFVTSATYGVEGKNTIDVTNEVESALTQSDGGYSILADYQNQHYNDLFGDPDYGIVKTLTVNYVDNGVQYTTTIDEEHDLVITTNDPIASDVTDYFQSVLYGTTASVTVNSNAGPDYAWLNAINTVQTIADPAPGIQKGIVLAYTINGGATKTLVVPNVYNSAHTGDGNYITDGLSSATITL